MPSRGDSCRSHQNELSNASSSPSSRFSIPRNFLPCLHPIPRRLSRPMYFSFFFLPSSSFQSTLSPQGERPPFQITRRKLVYRSLGGLGPVVFLFLFFEEGTEDTVGFFGSLTRTFPLSRGTGLIMTGKRGKRERGEGLKHRHPKIRHCKFYWKSSLRIMRRYLRRICHLLSITELINISDNIILLRND